ncbi:MAG: phytoene desaturase family protein, partial [Geodermatophilaceae bacterium]
MPDVVVIGSGHNALISACYLARAGLEVTVLERDTVPGGAVSTVERFHGYLMDRGSGAHVMIRHTGIVEELDLARHGLEYQDMDPWGFAPFWTTDGEQVALTFSVDLDRTCASIEAVCGTQDAEAYQHFATDWAARNELVFEAFSGAPTPARIARSLWGLGRRTGLGGVELSRQFLTSGDALLDAHFADERLKTALAWLGAQSGPPMHEPATADLVGWTSLMHRRPPGHPKGGSGMLTTALIGRLRADGGDIRLGDGATQVLAANGRITGVRTESGDVITSAVVVAGCHVLTTMELLGKDAPTALTDRVRRLVRTGNGIGMAVRLGTTDLPRYPAAAADGSSYRAMQLITTSRQALRDAYADYLVGRPATRPPVVAMTFSAFDDTIAPPGRHNTTIWGQWDPSQPSSESWP